MPGSFWTSGGAPGRPTSPAIAVTPSTSSWTPPAPPSPRRSATPTSTTPRPSSSRRSRSCPSTTTGERSSSPTVSLDFTAFRMGCISWAMSGRKAPLRDSFICSIAPGLLAPDPGYFFHVEKVTKKTPDQWSGPLHSFVFLLTLRPDSLLFPMTSPGRWQTLRRRYSLALQSSSLASPPGSTLLLRDYRATGTVRAILPWCSHIP